MSITIFPLTPKEANHCRLIANVLTRFSLVLDFPIFTWIMACANGGYGDRYMYVEMQGLLVQLYRRLKKDGDEYVATICDKVSIDVDLLTELCEEMDYDDVKEQDRKFNKELLASLNQSTIHKGEEQ